MFSEFDNKQFVCAKINSLGLNVKSDKVFLVLASSGNNSSSIRAEFKSQELTQLVDMYVDELIASNAPFLQTEPLRVKLKYFLQVFDKLGYGTFLLKHSDTSAADIGFFDICDLVKRRIELTCSTPDSVKDKYRSLMEVEGRVLISRHALTHFYRSEYLDFISYCRSKLIDVLGTVYWTFVDMTRTYSLLNQYQYRRKINKDWTLSLSIDDTSYPLHMHERYITRDTVNGEQLTNRNNEAIKKLYMDVASGNSVPVHIKVDVMAQGGVCIYSGLLAASASYSRKAVIKIHNRKELLKEIIPVIRCLQDERKYVS